MIQTVAYKRIRTVLNSVLMHFDINATQWIMLGVLYESTTGLRITDIARSVEVEVPLITRLSRTLLDAGLVRESTAVTTDKRARPLALTSRGKSLISKIEKELEHRMQKLEKGMSDREVKRYFQTLEAFTNNAAL